MKKKRRGEHSIAEDLGGIPWEYHPDEEDNSLLQPMSDYFEHFPWRGDPRASEIEQAMEKAADDSDDEDAEINI